jgi:nicotinamide mononucleotide transporter
MSATMLRYLSAHLLESAGMLATIAGIWLTTRRILICWPLVLLADILYFEVFYRAQLYSDAILQICFVIFTLYGWWHWWRGVVAEGDVRIEPLAARGWIIGLAAGALGTVVLGALMSRVGAALPHLDAALASYSLVASWWAARKHIASWWLWIVIDLAYIGEYLYKDLRLTALLYAGLVGLAMLGLRDWRRAEAIQTAD